MKSSSKMPSGRELQGCILSAPETPEQFGVGSKQDEKIRISNKIQEVHDPAGAADLAEAILRAVRETRAGKQAVTREVEKANGKQ